MISEFKATKFYYETMFASKWVNTPIHYMYQEFKQPKNLSWINVIYHPSRVSSGSLARESSMVESSLGVVCWAENDVEVLDLADSVVAFLEDNNEHDLFHLGDIQVIDQGLDQSNKAFIYMHFTISNRTGACNSLPLSVKKLLVNKGVQLTDNGTILTN